MLPDSSQTTLRDVDQDTEQYPTRVGKTPPLGNRFTGLQSSIRSRLSLSRLIQKSHTLLRTLGLSALTFFRGSKDEPPKVLLQSSKRLALARCTIHIAPAILSIALVAINLVGFFVGAELQGPRDQDDLKLGLLQVAAKIQELLVVASTGSIIFHILRSELVFGEGVPLGLLVSGWNFSQAQYFWSPEFLGCLSCSNIMTRKERWKRRGICFFVLLSGVLALLAGPASALLMIPREIDWPVGGGIYWLNGSEGQLWPTRLDDSYYSEVQCSGDSQFLESRCPVAGFSPLYRYYSTWWHHLNTGFSIELLDYTMRKRIYARLALRIEANTWSFTTHAATATLQDAMRNLHSNALGYLQKYHPWESPYPNWLDWAKPIRFQVTTKVPVARVLCQPNGMVGLWDDNLTAEFLNIRQFDEWWDKTAAERGDREMPIGKRIDILGSMQKNLANRGLLRNSSSLLPWDIFQDGRRTLIFPVEAETTGNSFDLVVLLGAAWRGNPDYGTPLSDVLSCSVDARWVKGSSVMEMTSKTQLSHEYHLGKVRNLVETRSDFLDKQTLGGIRYTPPDDGSWPQIKLAPSWYNMLAPTLPDEPFEGMPWLSTYGSNQTTLEALFNLIYDPLRTSHVGLENIIATSVVDGLSRSGLIPNFNGSRFLEAWPLEEWTVENESLTRTMVRKGSPKESFPSPSILQPNMTRMVMKATYRGYVMQAKGWFNYLSVFALLMHAFIAVVHTFLLIRCRTTSGAWDTILELLVLSHRSESPPEHVLANTSAGVASYKTVKLIACVEAPQGGTTSACDGAAGSRGELRLRLRESQDDRDPSLKPEQAGQTYGSRA